MMYLSITTVVVHFFYRSVFRASGVTPVTNYFKFLFYGYKLLLYPKLNSDPVNSFPTLHSIPQVPFTVSIPQNVTLTAILRL